MDISQQQREEGVKFICDEIEHVIKEFGDRDPGSEGENKALDYMRSQLDEFSDETHRESYKVAPHAFFGWTYITATCALIAIVTLFFAPVVSVVLLVLGLLPMIGEFVFYKEAIDFLFKKRTSGNVMGTIKPTGEVKRRVVLNGHSDAVYEWHWHYVGGYKGWEDLGFDSTEYQIRKWGAFIWTSGDQIVEQHVHNLDVIMWALGDNRFPVEVRAWGGRSADADLPAPQYGDRFTHCVVDYDFGEGVRLMSSCSQERKTSGEVGERVVGSKATLVTSGGRCKFVDRKGKTIYVNTQEIVNPYVAEHKFLLDAIRNGRRVNTMDALLGSNLIAIAGRMSAFSGKKFKYGWMLAKSQESLAPKEWKFGKRAVSVPVPGKYELV